MVVAWHQLDDGAVVLSPAPWRANFAGGARATVRCRGRRHECVGTLDTDPDSVAAVINTMLSAGTSARGLALRVPTGHRVTRDDVVATRRALVRFRPAGQAGEA